MGERCHRITQCKKKKRKKKTANIEKATERRDTGVFLIKPGLREFKVQKIDRTILEKLKSPCFFFSFSEAN